MDTILSLAAKSLVLSDIRPRVARYALAGLTADQVGVLSRAAPGIAGLTASLGFREVHATYLTEEDRSCSSRHR